MSMACTQSVAFMDVSVIHVLLYKLYSPGLVNFGTDWIDMSTNVEMIITAASGGQSSHSESEQRLKRQISLRSDGPEISDAEGRR